MKIYKRDVNRWYYITDVPNTSSDPSFGTSVEMSEDASVILVRTLNDEIDRLETFSFDGLSVSKHADEITFQRSYSLYIKNFQHLNLSADGKTMVFANDDYMFPHANIYKYHFGKWQEIAEIPYNKETHIPGAGIDISADGKTLMVLFEGKILTNEFYKNYINIYEVGSSVDIESQNLPVLKIWPNPTNDWLMIDNSTSSIKDVTLYNTTGQIVPIQVTNQTDMIQLDVSSLPANTYLININLGQNIQTIKFVKI